MAEFLDKNGLSYFWSKIKALLNQKANTDHKHEEIILHKLNGTQVVGYASELTINKYEVEVKQAL